MTPSIWQLLIVLVIVLLLFGRGKIPQLMGDMAKGIKSFKRGMTEEEKKSLKVLCQGAAIRFLLTRVFDYLNLTEGALVKIKDPVEYLKRLEFHDNVENYQDYFF